ncbi:hypothetical protein BDD12DRAFT_883199 [Trichophaea hybrida]|nr:hypothetical protein BDD12DRAFT_883199 [Trichophaea hybrida]
MAQNIGMDEISSDCLSFLIHHVFLPPKLPQTAEESSGEKYSVLLRVIHRTSELYVRQLPNDAYTNSVWPAAVKMLKYFCQLDNYKSLSAGAFATAVEEMTLGDAIALHITSQNAGLVLRRTGSSVIFTSFEASPASIAVNTTTGKLLISYPGPAIAVPWIKVTDPNFLSRLVDFVDKMKRDHHGVAAGRGMKAGETVQEERESSHPRFVSEMLTGILRAVGEEVEVERFMKRIGDEVLWNDAKIPWRRSPLWLVVRVALRMVLGKELYKCFMIFFMTQVLDHATRRGVQGDTLLVMNAKVARRVYKLRDRMPRFVLDGAQAVVYRAYTWMEDEWSRTQNSVKRLDWDISRLNHPEKAATISMLHSRDYVKMLKYIKYQKLQRAGFVPHDVERNNTWGMQMPDMSQAMKAGKQKDIMLADFETWVTKSLSTWLFHNLNRPEACHDLGERIQDYLETTKKAYQDNPERNSIMILTTMELWVALDSVAVECCPLLAEYSPEFNESLLSTLLLPQAQQRTRLSHVEVYIKNRRSAALTTSISVFSNDITKDCFSVRYFHASSSHQRLAKKITQHANAARRAKKDELKEKQKQYDRKQDEILARSCDYTTHPLYGWKRHSRECYKCQLITEASKIRIEIHEWPLPADKLEAAAVVFELECPAPFTVWREATYHIRTSLCCPKQPQPSDQRPHESVSSYPGLKKYFEADPHTRQSKLLYASPTKSFLASHYSSVRFPTTLENIFVKNALCLELYDTTTSTWTGRTHLEMSVGHLCTFRLPDGPYNLLQYAIRGYSHSSNQVLARQYECPAELQLHEYVAFGHLRSGRHLQWFNILRELRSRTLTFSSEAVCMLIMQAVWQVGLPGSDGNGRECHIQPGEYEFGKEMMRELRAMLKGVEANWQEVVAVQTMVVLAGQLLAVTGSREVMTEAVAFLREARRVSLEWTRELDRKLLQCKPSEVREFQLRVVQMAATCRMTFNVAECHLQDVLCSDEDISAFVECATMIYDNFPPISHQLQTAMKVLIERDIRMAYEVEGHLRCLITNSTKGIDLKMMWSAYEQGEPWTAMEGRSKRWVYTHTEAREGSESQEVHYNLISGELLVDGLPLGRMPATYTGHETYLELFGEKVLDVLPASMPGMVFQAKHLISSYIVAFAMNGKDLVIRTQRQSDGPIQQLIPRIKLSSDFPANIINSHVFWLRLPSPSELSLGRDYTHGQIDLRDADTPWTTKDGWYISHSYDSSKTQLNLGPGRLLLDIRSAIVTMITNALAPLENAVYIDVCFKGAITNVHLSRLKLDFMISWNNKLECRQFPGMVIDEDQRIGTFIGLRNMLVVRQGLTRSVIVPHGKVSFEQQGSHMQVNICTAGMDRVKYHIYTVNTIVGMLVGNGSLTSHLYKIYLHAVTSHYLPDSLTRRTGTEEALAGLRAAATTSFQTVEAESVDTKLFGLIAELTPVRLYYPVHLKRMQQVKWNQGLSPLVQHEEFCQRVKEVLAYAGLLNIFEDRKGTIASQASGAKNLTRRAAIRNSVFRTEQFGGSMAGKFEDRIYNGRDVVNGSADEARVFYVAGLVERWSGMLNVHPELLEMLEGLDGEIQGPLTTGQMSKLELGYDQKWLAPNLAEVWITLYNALREDSVDANKYDLMFLLGTMAYSGKIDLKLIETLLAFATDEIFKYINPPYHSSYNLRHGYAPDAEVLIDIVRDCAIEFEDSEEYNKQEDWFYEYNQTEEEIYEWRLQIFIENKNAQVTALVQELLTKWPIREPGLLEDYYPIIDVTSAVFSVRPRFESWNRNSEFRSYMEEVQQALNEINSKQQPEFQLYHFEPCKYRQSLQRNTIGFSDLLARSPPALPSAPSILERSLVIQQTGTDQQSKDDSLETLLRDFRGRQPNKFRKKYTGDLEQSIVAFHTELAHQSTLPVVDLEYRLKSNKSDWNKYILAVFQAIETRLGPLHLKGSRMLQKAGLWPRVSPGQLLHQLATNAAVQLSKEWKEALVIYGTGITMVQRLDRLLRLLRSTPRHGISPEISSDFLRELDNTGHENWDPILHPDWLLIEIENNFLIRKVQADIASFMIMPEENKNSIMQLCMGEGKTSVIVPIVAASLADTTKLVRVVVLKPLSGQMFQTLVQKLGGLVNRRIFFMPFSRGIKMGKEEIRVVQKLYDDCMKSGGILLVQLEHLLSFKLLGLEWLYNSKHKKAGKTVKNNKSEEVGTNDKSDVEVAQWLLDKQKWLDEHSRDILDESDEILNVKHELIYTIGEPTPLENHPDRWVIIQEIFDLIQEHFKSVVVNVSDYEVETHEQATRFGSIRILNLTAGRQLLRDIAQKIVEDQLLSVSFRLFPVDKRKLAAKFIGDADMPENEATPLLKYFGDNNISSGILYLLRGLIAHNILLFSLMEKRWKVDYGLDLKRSLLAVPYRAKDSPAGKAEFSHPDVALTLTCLSYYYGGLSETQLETCFKNLHKSDNSALKYERWIKGVVLPQPYLKRLNGINLDDKKQWHEVTYPIFRYNKAVIDSYLSDIVFPKQAKEFPHKLSTSGWDVAGSKTHPTTGFSGTNDNRYLLPLSIRQLDTKEQLNTNARVLSYLLQKENSYMRTAGPNEERISVEDLLRTLTKHPGNSQVLLDVGAQVLELRNDEVAKKWLELVPTHSAQAAVYFNDSDELSVLTRDGNTEPLMVSAFADRLGKPGGSYPRTKFDQGSACTSLYEDAETRKWTLRNLLRASRNDRKILKIAQEDNREDIGVRDVLYWCMEETCSNTRKLSPIWAKQGIGYQQRVEAWKDIGNEQFPKGLLEKESKALQEHYGFERSKNDTVKSFCMLGAKNSNIDKLLERCKDLGVKTFRGAKMLEEQERELAHEVERERENQRPPKMNTLKHHLSEEVKKFITTGTVRQTSRDPSTCIIPAFSVLERTSANGHEQQRTAFSQKLLATSDFCQVIERRRRENDTTDRFLRPVNWIVSSNVDRSILVIMSSFEVNRLLPEIRKSTHVILHVYNPQVTRTTPSYELLNFCRVPRLPLSWMPNTNLVDELNIFAGQLYFRNYNAYERVCGFLGLHLQETSPDKAAAIQSDGFVEESERQALGMRYRSPFKESPIGLLRALIGFRRDGQSYIVTHMGHVLHGRLLTEEDFEVQGFDEELSGVVSTAE